MHDQPYCSVETKILATSLIRVQRDIGPAIKDKFNQFTQSQYATLNSIMDSCRDALLANGIWLTQYPVPADPGFLGLVTKLVHAESGQWQTSHAVVPLPKNDPQGFGIAMTYVRRYSIAALLGIVMEEDTDGNMTLEAAKPSSRQKKHVSPEIPRASQVPSSVQRPSAPPILDGVTYQEVVSSDGQKCIIATGNTQAKKDLLAGAGFKWNPQRKMWWKYSDSPQNTQTNQTKKAAPTGQPSSVLEGRK